MGPPVRKAERAQRLEDEPAGFRRIIGLLGGSFNPPHVAHLMLAYWARATQRVSEVWLLPAYRHPFGKHLAEFEHRVEMCRLSVKPLRGVHVCPAEAELANDPLVGKTARTLEHLRVKHPNFGFALIVGSDVMSETVKWYRWDRVTELARIIVAGRVGHPSSTPGGPLFPDVSSTEVRARLRRGEDVSDVVPDDVLKYISRHGLYR
jgi:nicotinate-nucleotide adenylyltransferase